MPETISQTPLEILGSMGAVGVGVFVFLILMSLYSITIMIERYRYLGRARRQTRAFAAAARPLLDAGKVEEVLAESRRHLVSHLARVYAAGIQDFDDTRRRGSIRPGFEATIRGASEREATLVAQDLKRGLGVLASIGATAPFVGLFGTVVGIMNAFFGMARAGQGGIGAVAGGIAEALVNTAVGLFVALPAVWAYNYYLGRIEQFSVEMAAAAGEIADYFVKNHRSA